MAIDITEEQDTGAGIAEAIARGRSKQDGTTSDTKLEGGRGATTRV